MRKNQTAALVFIISIIFLFVPGSLTGWIISENLRDFSYFNILGLIFIFISMVIFASRQSLDAIIIPTGSSFEEDRKRTKRAEE